MTGLIFFAIFVWLSWGWIKEIFEFLFKFEKNIVLFGPPGCGKGTQSKKLSAKFDLLHLSTGDLLREEIRKDSEIGKQVSSLGSGILVDDEIVIKLVSDKIAKNPGRNFLFDGFPRTVDQAKALQKLLKVDCAILLMVDDEEVIKRIIKRGEKSGRADDNEEAAMKRLEEYKSKTFPLKQYYLNKNILITIDGQGSIDEVFNDICKWL